jgi:carbonic anhydrase
MIRACLKTAVVVLSLAWLVYVWTAGNAQEKPGLTPEQAWQRLKAGNERFATDKLQAKDLGTRRRKELPKGQHPFAVVLSCADCRAPPEYVFDRGLGDLFVLRVAGNISDPFVLASIEYAVKQVRVPLVVVLGHNECGAVKAALGKVVAEVQVGRILPAAKDTALAAGIENNVRRQTELLTSRSAVSKTHAEQKKVRIVSGVYRLSTGKVDWFK